MDGETISIIKKDFPGRVVKDFANTS